MFSNASIETVGRQTFLPCNKETDAAEQSNAKACHLANRAIAIFDLDPISHLNFELHSATMATSAMQHTDSLFST